MQTVTLSTPSSRITTAFPYNLVDDSTTLHHFLHQIETHIANAKRSQRRAYLYFDSEGEDLGRLNGKLGLIQLGFWLPDSTTSASSLQVFLIDITSLAPPLIAPIRSMLASEDLIKIAWDGKMDTIELNFGLDCALSPILDLQVVETVHRMATLQPTYLTYVYGLLGLRKAVRQFEVFDALESVEVEQIDAVVKQQHTDKQSSLWIKRPLSEIMLRYASSDVFSIALLHLKFLQLGLLSVVNEAALMRSSARYCSLYTNARRHPDNRYTNHGFLPAGILDEPKPHEERLMCSGCRRLIQRRYFHPSAVPMKDSQRLCPVCDRINRRPIKQRY